MDVESVADELYGLRPTEFTAAREQRAARAREAGDRELAARIRALRRPTLAAWASNLLVRARPDEARSLVALGEAARRARRSPGGVRLRELDRRQHDLVAALAREAQRLTAEAGKEVGDAVREEVEATLRTVLADPGAAGAWLSGRLSRALGAPVGAEAAGAPGDGVPGHLPVAPTAPTGTEGASAAGKAPGPRTGPSPAGPRSGARAGGGDSGGTGRPDPAAARRTRREQHEADQHEAERRRAEGEAAAARREAAAREDEARHARDALEGAEQRAHEADLRAEELVARLKEAQARKEAAHGAVRQARERALEAERAARRAAKHAQEAIGRLGR